VASQPVRERSITLASERPNGEGVEWEARGVEREWEWEEREWDGGLWDLGTI
jgi:hypothetical protein